MLTDGAERVVAGPWRFYLCDLPCLQLGSRIDGSEDLHGSGDAEAKRIA